MPNLNDKWGSKEIWLRVLYLRANVMWIFRQELLGLELEELRWLNAILNDAYLAITMQAARFTNNEEAFRSCLELITNYIEQRIERAPADAELQRLLQLTRDARPSDVIQGFYDKLAGDARNIYRMA